MFVGLFLFFGVAGVNAAPPASYYGPINAAGCKADLKECSDDLSSKCGWKAPDNYYIAEKALSSNICDDWSATEWKTIHNFFGPCYDWHWSQSTTFPFDSSKSKYGHLAGGVNTPKWKFAQPTDARQKPGAGPWSEKQACDHFFGNTNTKFALFSAGITKNNCVSKATQCKELYEKCNLTGGKNDFSDPQKLCNQVLSDDSQVGGKFTLFDQCADGLAKLAKPVPGDPFCKQAEKLSEGKKCQCLGGVIEAKYGNHGLQPGDASCCQTCKTAKIKFDDKEVSCATALKIPTLKDNCSCEGVAQTYALQKTGSELKKQCCGLCASRGFEKKVSKVKFGSGEVGVCGGYSCGDGKTPKLTNPSANPALLKKQLCKACTSEEVVLNGSKEKCARVITVNPIKAYPDPLAASGVNNPQKFIANLIKTFLGIIGSIALALVVYGGFIWMTSAGETARVETGRKTVQWAAFGLVAVFSSYVIVAFIFKSLG